MPVIRPDRKIWRNAYRIINSAFPPLSVFEDVLDPADLETAYAIEAMTNDRLREEAGELWRVPQAERVSGPGSTPVMAAFTHIGMPTRFSDGTYGVYYCASSLQAAIAETSYHRAEFLAATREDSLELTMRVYINRIVKPLHDIRAGFDALHDPDTRTYPQAQAFGREVRAGGSWGLLYRSVRAPGHECAAIFRPRAASLPLQGPHLRYVWDGKAQAFTHVLEISEL
ncbi:RES family NAD+ phosphorylase [Pseudomonas sp. gcc21]|uniref:RES family NAD+ phosphorylase n=1 Tax=Pseudomonas sp. gcc21 TaxID=2726989 RepID=UPI0014521FCA|nr:RES family NAD+ phosphorylase [Pseudomonas sp. gcc21]QJD60894.1 RES family NAD+ phosphorylase [Pseudomonas sp. gcc21]